MSNKECPHQPELVMLLGRDGDAAHAQPLGEHLGGCAICQAELALLRDGFAAMGEDLLSQDAQAQEHIAARVMPQILAELVPVPVWRPARSRVVLVGALTTLAAIPAALYWMKAGNAPLKPGLALGLALLPLGLLPAVSGSLRLQKAALGLAIGLTAAVMLATVDNFDLTILRGAGCLFLAASGSVLPALVVLRAARKETAGALTGALQGAAIGSGGAALQRLLCDNGDLTHALLFHLGPFLFLMALAALLGSWIARTTPQSAPQQAA